MVLPQLGIAAPYDQACDTGIMQAEEDELAPQRPGFPAPSCAAVGGVLRPGGEEKVLAFVRDAPELQWCGRRCGPPARPSAGSHQAPSSAIS